MTTSVENEWLCSRIAHAYGIPVAETQIKTFGATKPLKSASSILGGLGDSAKQRAKMSEKQNTRTA